MANVNFFNQSAGASRRLLVIVPVLMALAGCDVANQTADEIARDQAKSVVNGVVADKFPGVNAAPITDCIIDNASRGEIFDVAKASVTGVDEGTISTVTKIIQRPDTTTCIAKNSLSLLKL